MIKQVKMADCLTCQSFGVSPLCALKTDDIHHIQDNKLSFKVRKNHELFNEGDLVGGVHCIQSGKLKLYKTLADGSKQVLRIAKPGEFVGYRGILGNGRYISTAAALEDCVVCMISKDRFFEMIGSNLNFALKIMGHLANDLSNAESKAVSFIQKDSRARLAERLLLLQTSFGTTPEGHINIQLTREEIASMSGMATETAVRLLHAWETSGILALDRRNIKIIKQTEVASLAQLED